jgi:hypothetical protein
MGPFSCASLTKDLDDSRNHGGVAFKVGCDGVTKGNVFSSMRQEGAHQHHHEQQREGCLWSRIILSHHPTPLLVVNDLPHDSSSLSNLGLGVMGVALLDPLYIEELQKKPELCDTEDDSLDEEEQEEEDDSWCLDVPDSKACPSILTPALFQQLCRALPPALQRTKWERCFAIGRDGDCMRTMLNCCRPYNYTLLVIHTTQGHVLGGFCTESWTTNRQTQGQYYGTGQSFLYTSDETGEAQIYKWTGDNDYCQIFSEEEDRLAMGGQGEFGLALQDNFSIGQSGCSATFGNPPLVPGGRFDIAEMEIYGPVSGFCL